MPEEFDPVWEYAAPDPEIMEAVYLNGRPREHGIDLYLEFTQDGRGRGHPDGTYVGKGNPNVRRLKLARERPRKIRERKPTVTAVCDGCGHLFQTRRPGVRARCVRRFCSRSCWEENRGRLDTPLYHHRCRECGDQFVSRWPCSLYCNQGCSAAAARRWSRRAVAEVKGKVTKTCQNSGCGKTFIVPPSWGHRKYCCRECSDVCLRAGREERGRKTFPRRNESRWYDRRPATRKKAAIP